MAGEVESKSKDGFFAAAKASDERTSRQTFRNGMTAVLKRLQLGNVLAEDIVGIAKASPMALSGSAANVAVIGTALWAAGPYRFVELWLIGSLCLFGYFGLRWHLNDHRAGIVKKRYASKRAVTRLLIFSFLLALPFGLLPFLFIGSVRPALEVAIFCVAAGVAAGGSFFMARVPAAALIYMFTVTIPVVASCLLLWTPDYKLIVIFTVVYMVFLVAATLHNAGLFTTLHKNVEDLERSAKDLNQARLDMEKIAETDPVTGLYNRRALTRLLNEEIESVHQKDSSVSLYLIDLDNFKGINDSLGHIAGDTFLKEIGNRLKGLCDECEIAARYGGDEFAFVTRSDITNEQIEERTRTIVDTLGQSFKLGRTPVAPGASVGVSSYPRDGSSVNDILACADQALLTAKATGRGSICIFGDSLREEFDREKRNRKALRAALARDELTLWYQPQIDLETGQLYGFEALVRWNHPDLGILGPAQFFPTAENGGMILELSDFSVERAHEDIRRWRADGLNTGQISINLHGAQLQHAHRLKKLLDRSLSDDLATHDITLEITEGCIIGRGTEHIPQLLNELRDRGYRISLDDFGTGYASLTHLRYLPVDELKIDRSFTSGILENAQDMSIVTSITQMANALDMEVVVEGIETAGHVAPIHKAGASIGQGYFFSKPMPAEEVETYLRKEMWSNALGAEARRTQGNTQVAS